MMSRRQMLTMIDPIKEYTIVGNPVSFNTNVAKPLKQLLIPFTPVQSGTGDPSPENVRPITGWTGVNVTRTGMNMLDPSTKTSSSSTVKEWCKSKGFLCRGGIVYKVVANYGYGTVYVTDWATGTTITSHAQGKLTYAPADDRVVYFRYYNSSVPSDLQLMVEIVPTPETFADDYEPYTGTTIPITFPAVGKNLLNPAEIVKGLYSSADFSMTSTSSDVYRSAKVYLKKGEYTISFGVNINIARLVKDEVYTSSFPATMNNISSYTFTVESDGYFGISWRDTTSSSTVWDDTTPVQIESRSSATSYEPYTNTVYGGEFDLTTGVLTVEYGKIVKNTSNMNGYSEDAAAWVEGAGIKALVGEGVNSSEYDVYSDKGNRVTINTVSWRDNIYLPQNGNNLTQSEWKALATDVTFIVRLAEPIVYQLTPQQVSTIKGFNTIYSDTNGENTIKYLKKG